MITHIHATTIVVSDQDKAIHYYCNVLGWKKTDDAPMGEHMRWVTVAPAGAATSISLSLHRPRNRHSCARHRRIIRFFQPRTSQK